MSVNEGPSQKSPTRRLREQAGMTREQLAVKAGVSSSTVYLAERAGLLSDAIAAKLARVLGVEPSQLKAVSR
jgi:transcriptional regulator with XRE-family HTH domain